MTDHIPGAVLSSMLPEAEARCRNDASNYGKWLKATHERDILRSALERLGGVDHRFAWITAAELRGRVQAMLPARSDPANFARAQKLSDETVLSFLRKGRPPGPRLLAAVAYERQTFYRPIG